MQEAEPLQRARVTTAAFPEGKRLATWREVYGRGITNVDIEPIGDGPFHADVTFSMLPNVSIATGSRSPAHYRVTRELAGRGKDIVILSALRSGVASTNQFGKESSGGVGSASVMTSADPLTASLYTPGTFTTLALSVAAIEVLAPRYSAVFGKPIASNNPALKLLIRYLDILQDDIDLDKPQIAQSVSDHILDLTALALGARDDYAEMARQRGARAARLSAITTDILRELGRSDLSSEFVALRHGISPRYLRKLFEQQGTSFSTFVLTERIVKAHRMLIDRRYAHLNIAQVAHENGFGDISYFNRAFRRHFQATPSDFREAARRVWNEEGG